MGRRPEDPSSQLQNGLEEQLLVVREYCILGCNIRFAILFLRWVRVQYR